MTGNDESDMPFTEADREEYTRQWGEQVPPRGGYVLRCEYGGHDIERGERHLTVRFLNQNRIPVKSLTFCAPHALITARIHVDAVFGGIWAGIHAEWEERF